MKFNIFEHAFAREKSTILYLFWLSATKQSIKLKYALFLRHKFHTIDHTIYSVLCLIEDRKYELCTLSNVEMSQKPICVDIMFETFSCT